MESENIGIAMASAPATLLRERNLVLQFFAFVIAAASTVAIALVGMLSIGCHAAVMPLMRALHPALI